MTIFMRDHKEPRKRENRIARSIILLCSQLLEQPRGAELSCKTLNGGNRYIVKIVPMGSGIDKQ